MSSEPISPASPTHLQSPSDTQWIQGNEPAPQNGSVLQWKELPPPEMVPVPCNDLSAPYTVPVFNQQKFNLPNGVNLNNFNPQNVNPPNPYINEGNGFCLPNGTRVFNRNVGNSSNYRPGIPNGAMNGWVQAVPNPNRMIIRPGWNNTGTKTTGGGRKPKRIRTAFTSQQMMQLEQEYSRTRYLDRTRRIEMAETLHLNERTIKIWFQNRRMKEKKDKAESMDESEASSTTDSSSELNCMPIVIHEHIPHEIYERNLYMEHYPAPPMPLGPVSMPQSVPSQVLNYPYLPEDYEQYRQAHMQMQQYPPPYNNDIQQIVDNSPPQGEEAANVQPSNIIEQSWDLSWIKSIEITDDC